MAPEQIEGRPRDARTDIFALGAMLYEMATGRRAFAGDESPAPSRRRFCVTIRRRFRPFAGPVALIGWSATCLAKDPEQRWQTAHDVQLQLGSMPASGPVAVWRRSPPARRPLARAAVGIAGTAPPSRAVSFARPRRARSRRAAVIRFSCRRLRVVRSGTISKTIRSRCRPTVCRSRSSPPTQPAAQRIWLRPFSAIDARPVAETEGASSVIWSPDSRSIAFFVGGNLKRRGSAGGAAVTVVTDFTGSGMSGRWGRDGQILFAAVGGDAIYRVPASGGPPWRSEAGRDAG